MRKVFRNGKVYINEKFENIDFVVDNGKFVEFGEFDNGIDLKESIVIPGLYDIHTHGAVGVCFDDITEDDFEKVYNYYVSNGATSVLATTMTLSDEKLKSQLSILADLCEKYPIFKGIHMEGPFLSHEYKGAMNPEFLQLPNVEKFKEFQKCARGYIKLITVAPELEGSEEFIKAVSEMGVIVSLGHSSATYTQTNRAIDCGAKSFTHTFNAMKPISHKGESSILVSALESDNYTEIIADGKHVNKDLFKLLVKSKGLDKIIGITDSLAEAGLPDGEYVQQDGRVISKVGGDLFYLNTTTRAGSSIGIFDCLYNFSEFTGELFEKCIPVYSQNASNLLNIQNGSISTGLDADFLIVKDDQIIQTYSKGNCVFER